MTEREDDLAWSPENEEKTRVTELGGWAPRPHTYSLRGAGKRQKKGNERGSPDRAKTLFDETARATFSERAVVTLAEEGAVERAKALFEQTVKFAKQFSVAEIERVAAAGLRGEAETLFKQTFDGYLPRGGVDRLHKAGLTTAMLKLLDEHDVFLPSAIRELDAGTPPFVPLG